MLAYMLKFNNSITNTGPCIRRMMHVCTDGFVKDRQLSHHRSEKDGHLMALHNYVTTVAQKHQLR